MEEERSLLYTACINVEIRILIAMYYNSDCEQYYRTYYYDQL